jgi:hypothetical protein
MDTISDRKPWVDDKYEAGWMSIDEYLFRNVLFFHQRLPAGKTIP